MKQNLVKARGLLLAAALVFLAVQAASAAVRSRNFPVELKDGISLAAPILLDIDSDGTEEILIGTRNSLYALEADGNLVEGFPLDLKPFGRLATGIAGASLDGESGKMAVVFFGTEDGKLVAMDGSGRILEGFPFTPNSAVSAAPSVAEYEETGGPAVAFGTISGSVYLLDFKGRPISGFPRSCGAKVSTSVTVSRLSPSERPVLVFGDARGQLHAWGLDGKELSGFPFRAKFTISSQPVLGDLNDDGRYEIVFGSEDFNVYAVDGNGKLLKGFPQKTGYRVYAAPALADVDGDGRVEIITAGGDGKLYVHRHDGKRLAGFPRRIGSRLTGSACAGDLDGDGKVEIVAGSDKGKLYVFRSGGARYPGFPVSLADRVEVSCLIGDFDHDGVNEVLAAARNGQVGSWRIIRKGSKTHLDWPMEARDARRTGRTWPNPPRYTDLKILPEKAPTTAKLRVHYRHFDLDGDPEPETIINWYRNGKLVKELSGSREVDARFTAKHQRWKFVLQAEKDGPRFESPTVEIVNSPPEPAVVEIVPAEPRHGNSLEVKVSKPSYDADGDRIRYRYTWLRDKVPLKKQRRARIPGGLVRKGQRWTAVVRPFDGEVEGSPSYASVTVGNTPPEPPVVAIAPAHPRVTDSLKAVVKKPSTDVDGDGVEYRYIWRIGREKLNLAYGSAEMPARMAKKGEQVKLEVVPFDGQEEGKSAFATARVENSPPGTPEVVIHPPKPNTLDILTVRITTPAPDADGDALVYRAGWKLVQKGAKPKRVDGFVLPAKQTAKGQTWRAEVAAFDGQESGKPAVAEVEIDNAAPSPPRLAAEKDSVQTTEPLKLKVLEKAADPDGDKVTVSVEWFRLEGKKFVKVHSGTEEFVLPPEKTRKNRFYVARATASDGMTTSEPEEVWFEVRNTPPPPCKVRIEPARPRTGQQLNARADRAEDADGDGLELHFEWFVNGKPEIDGKGSPSVPARMVKAGQRWRIDARWYDGEEYGPGCNAQVEVVDSPPVAPKIALEPERPACGQALKLRIVEPARDPDPQPVELETRWFTNGKRRKEFDGTLEIPAGVARKGQRWAVEAVARAAGVKSKPARAEVTVGNCAPNRPKLSIEPKRPLSSQDVRCVLAAATVDPDGDRVRHDYRWFVVDGKGKEMPLHDGAILPAEKTKKGQRIRCVATATDGEATSKPARAEVTVSNSAPEPPEVVLEPKRPSTKDRLVCKLSAPAKDPDGDRVKLLFFWYKDGVRQSFAPQSDSVPARLTSPGDIWQCAVKATDGQLESAEAYSSEVVVGK